MHTRLLSLLAFAAAGCSSGLQGPKPITNSNVPLGFDPGVSLTNALTNESAVAGAFVPGGQGKADRQIVFLAFVTASAANDADGAGAPLVRDASVPLDGNLATDVFLAAIENTDLPTSQGPMPITFRQGLLNVFRHDRCVHCHGVGHVTPAGETEVFELFAHPGGRRPLLTDANGDGVTDCHECHFSPTHTGTGINWFAPQPQPFLDGIAPNDNPDDYTIKFDLRGRSVAELNLAAQIDPTGNNHGGGPVHLKSSPNIAWAMNPNAIVPPAAAPNDANVPGVEPGSTANTLGLDRGPVPITRARFLALVDAWEDGGFQADTSSATKDIALVSQRDSGAIPTSGNGASFSPSIAYVPNPAFDPNVPGERPAGSVHVVFASDAPDLVAGATVANTDIYRVEFEVWIDSSADGAGDAVPGSVDLRRRNAPNELISRSTAVGVQGGNGDSGDPSIDATSTWVAFVSHATNLRTFSDHNGAGQPDVFVRHLPGQVTALASTIGGAIDGGNNGSFNPSLSADGTALAFESLATDLVAGDTNGQRDVFYARLNPATGSLSGGPIRASVQSGGAQATGGASRNASIAVRTDVVVAFESDKTNLVVAPGALPATNVYIHDVANDTTTLLSKKLRGGGSTVIADGISRLPQLSPDGSKVVYQTLAGNLEEDDESEVTERVGPGEYSNSEDVILAELDDLLTTGIRDFGNRRLSRDVFGRGGRGNSSLGRIGVFTLASGDLAGGHFAVFSTSAENLGKADATNLVAVFLRAD